MLILFLQWIVKSRPVLGQGERGEVLSPFNPHHDAVGDSLILWVKLRQEWEKFGAKEPRVFIQGSSQFVEDMLKMLDGQVTKSVSAMTPKSSGGELRLEGLSARREVPHKSQGGVTTGKWTLHSKFNVELPSNGVKCLLGHIVTPVESGHSISSDDKLSLRQNTFQVESTIF